MTPTQADLVREMCAQMRAYLDGHIGGTALGQWATDARTPNGLSTIRGHGTAHSVLKSLIHLDDEESEIRRSDVETYLRWLTEGSQAPLPDDPLVMLRLTPDEIASVLSLRTVRWWLDGLGWVSEVRFVAPGTGRPFLAGWLDYPAPELGDYRSCITTDHARDAQALLDLFDTLCIDLSDIPPLDGKPGWNEAISVEGLPRWRLMRQDDNGRRFEMETFTAPRKARERLQAYEALHHKQIYWLEVLETERLPAPSEAREGAREDTDVVLDHRGGEGSRFW
jgi:hypothetical protein